MSNESQKVIKKFEKNLKKFLTNRNDCDKLNKLSKDNEQRTLITKQWNTYDSRKFFTFLRTVEETKNSKNER